MRILHRIAFRASPAQQRELAALGVKLPSVIAMPGGGDPFVAFDIAEEDKNWSHVRALLQRWGVADGQIRTEFSKSEIRGADWLEIGAWHHGYPQPDEDVFGYRQATYDLTDWCEQCGIGKKQKSPFQMVDEPKWGRNGMMQLIWVYDELFVTPKVWTNVFEPAGIGRRPVMNTKGAELKTVLQLVVEEEVGVVTEGLASERCARCQRVKYLPVVRGPSPMLTNQPSKAMARTKEYFGSGGQADRRVLISQAVHRSLESENVRGPWFRPVQARNART